MIFEPSLFPMTISFGGFAMALLLLQVMDRFMTVKCDQFEFKLYEDLMMNYNPLERPVENNSDAVLVTLGVILQQIVDVDEKNQIIKLNAWLQYTWKDYKLNWDPSIYGGVSDVRFPYGTIWKPDVLLYNSVDSNFDSTYPSNFVVYSDGTVNWIPPGIFAIACKIDITWFPFDDQNCFFKFGSWTYNGFQLDLRPADENGLDSSEYLQNGEWALISTPVNRSEKFYECCPEPYPDLKFFLRMRRRTLYYGFNLIIPSLLISLMTVLGFTLPPDAGEKITLEITILLSVCFFLSMVADMTPPTSEAVPLVGAFFSCCMLVVSASVVTTVLVLNLHYRTAEMYEMSHVTRSILLHWLPWMLLMKRPGHYFSRKTLLNPFKQKEKEVESESLLRNVRSMEEQIGGGGGGVGGGGGGGVGDVNGVGVGDHRNGNTLDLEHRISQCLKALAAGTQSLDPGQQALLLMLQRIYSELKFVTKRMEEEDEGSDAENDWKFAAMVVDRLCLIVFSIFIICSSCGILFSAPYLVA